MSPVPAYILCVIDGNDAGGGGIGLGDDLGKLFFCLDEEVVCLNVFGSVNIMGTLLHDMDQVVRLEAGKG